MNSSSFFLSVGDRIILDIETEIKGVFIYVLSLHIKEVYLL